MKKILTFLLLFLPILAMAETYTISYIANSSNFNIKPLTLEYGGIEETGSFTGFQDVIDRINLLQAGSGECEIAFNVEDRLNWDMSGMAADTTIARFSNYRGEKWGKIKLSGLIEIINTRINPNNRKVTFIDIGDGVEVNSKAHIYIFPSIDNTTAYSTTSKLTLSGDITITTERAVVSYNAGSIIIGGNFPEFYGHEIHIYNAKAGSIGLVASGDDAFKIVNSYMGISTPYNVYFHYYDFIPTSADFSFSAIKDAAIFSASSIFSLSVLSHFFAGAPNEFIWNYTEDFTSTARGDDIVFLKKPAHTVTVINGSGSGVYSASYIDYIDTPSELVTIIANPTPFGYEFKGWNILHGDITLTNKPTQSFYMPNEPVVVEAIYERTASYGFIVEDENDPVPTYVISQSVAPDAINGIQNMIDKISSHATAPIFNIRFGRVAEELDIGEESVNFTGARWNNNVTLLGKIKASNTNLNGTIHLSDGASIISKADISNTGIFAISNNSYGTLTISEGNIYAPYYAVNNNSTGKIIINGGNISAMEYAVNNMLSGQLDITDGTITAANYSALNVASGALNILGGTISTIDTTNIAVHNESTLGAIVLGNTPIIKGSIGIKTEPMKLSVITAAINRFLPGTNQYTLYIANYHEVNNYPDNIIAVINGKDFLANFKPASNAWELIVKGNDLAINTTSRVPILKDNRAIAFEKLPAANSKFEIYNLQGKLVHSGYYQDLNLSKLPIQAKGMYIVKTATTTQRVIVK
jgi:hypothetical protein